jgi:thiamine biosynthesis protein ThiS
MTASITVRVNDQAVELAAGATLTSVMEHLGIDSRGTAIARNGEVAPRSQWSDTTLESGDHVEVLTVAQGG